MKIKLYTWRELLRRHAPDLDCASAYGISKETYMSLSKRLLTVIGDDEDSYLIKGAYFIPHEYVKEIINED